MCLEGPLAPCSSAVRQLAFKPATRTSAMPSQEPPPCSASAAASAPYPTWSCCHCALALSWSTAGSLSIDLHYFRVCVRRLHSRASDGAAVRGEGPLSSAQAHSRLLTKTKTAFLSRTPAPGRRLAPLQCGCLRLRPPAHHALCPKRATKKPMAFFSRPLIRGGYSIGFLVALFEQRA
jgi:hypothetical protein